MLISDSDNMVLMPLSRQPGCWVWGKGWGGDWLGHGPMRVGGTRVGLGNHLLEEFGHVCIGPFCMLILHVHRCVRLCLCEFVCICLCVYVHVCECVCACLHMCVI